MYKGTAQQLAATISKHASRADFFDYHEGPSKLSISRLLKGRRLLKDLHELNDNFSFQPSKLKQALKEVWEERQATWPTPLADEHREAWESSMASRLRTALLHLARATARQRTRSARPRWLEKLLADTDEGTAEDGQQGAQEEEEEEEGEQEEEQEQQEEEDAEEEEEDTQQREEEDNRKEESKDSRPTDDNEGDRRDPDDDYLYGYCFERCQAWRAPASKPNRREYTKVYAKEGSKPTDFACCVWDGAERVVTDLVVAELDARAQAVWSSSRGALWVGKLGSASLKLKKSVRHGSDKKPGSESLAIFKTESGQKPKQLLQVLVSRCAGDTPEEKRETAVKLGVSLCERLQSGTLPPGAALTAARDAEQGSGTTPRQPKQEPREPKQLRKRPAALQEQSQELEEEPKEESKLDKQLKEEYEEKPSKRRREEEEQEEEAEETFEAEAEENQESEASLGAAEQYRLARQELDNDLPPASLLDLSDSESLHSSG